MKITIDTTSEKMFVGENNQLTEFDLYSKQAFEIISDQWLKIGWDQKYPYTFTWLGRPIIQLPEDIIRIQEVIFSVQPDVIIETGVAHGGSLILYASLCKSMNKGRVIGIDIEIRPHNKKAIKEHPLHSFITLIEGSSIDPEIVKNAKKLIKSHEKVLVILDSCHTKSHVLQELENYSALVSPGSYIVATDGSMKDLYDVPRGKPEWAEDNPSAAAIEFLGKHEEFRLEQPPWLFNESNLNQSITHWPNAYLRKKE
jgi:cephalosporin hydroxylase